MELEELERDGMWQCWSEKELVLLGKFGKIVMWGGNEVKFGKIVKWDRMKYRTRGGMEWEDRRETICMRERERQRERKVTVELEKLKVWKLGKKKWENIKKIGTLENMKLESIRKIGSMGNVKNMD